MVKEADVEARGRLESGLPESAAHSLSVQKRGALGNAQKSELFPLIGRQKNRMRAGRLKPVDPTHRLAPRFPTARELGVAGPGEQVGPIEEDARVDVPGDAA